MANLKMFLKLEKHIAGIIFFLMEQIIKQSVGLRPMKEDIVIESLIPTVVTLLQ